MKENFREPVHGAHDGVEMGEVFTFETLVSFTNELARQNPPSGDGHNHLSEGARMKNERCLVIVTNCGETTCASEPGKFCRHVRTSHCGTRWVCGLFWDEDGPKELPEKDGWLARLPECLAAEEKEGKVSSTSDAVTASLFRP